MTRKTQTRAETWAQGGNAHQEATLVPPVAEAARGPVLALRPAEEGPAAPVRVKPLQSSGIPVWAGSGSGAAAGVDPLLGPLGAEGEGGTQGGLGQGCHPRLCGGRAAPPPGCKRKRQGCSRAPPLQTWDKEPRPWAGRTSPHLHPAWLRRQPGVAGVPWRETPGPKGSLPPALQSPGSRRKVPLSGLGCILAHGVLHAWVGWAPAAGQEGLRAVKGDSAGPGGTPGRLAPRPAPGPASCVLSGGQQWGQALALSFPGVICWH